MKTSQQWVAYFKQNRENKRIDWRLRPSITEKERAGILKSLKAWQLGETSDGKHLLRAAARYSGAIQDPEYVEAVALFIKEEQKHGNSLGVYIDLIGEKRIKKDWGDTLFRKVRYFNTSMELWTLAVLVVESTAQVFYQAMKDATGCALLKQICTDILVDEKWHIDFQVERMAIIYQRKPLFAKKISVLAFSLAFIGICGLVWIGHRRLFRAGEVNLGRFARQMKFKHARIVKRINEIANGIAWTSKKMATA